MMSRSPPPSAGSFGLASWRGGTRGMTAAHRHDDLEFNSADVDLEYLIDGLPQRIPAGTVAVFWAARPHQLVGSSRSGTESWLTVPLADALSWILPADFVRRMLAGEVLTTPAGDAVDLDALARRWSEELSASPRADPDLARIARIEVEAFTMRIARAASTASPSPSVPVPTSRIAAAAMAAFVSANSGEDLSVGDVASHVHLHPQYAMTVFRKALGVTIGDYLAQSRVARAQQLLLNTDDPIPQVGFAAGFRSQSQFYARFAQWCGEPPAVYRRRLRRL